MIFTPHGDIYICSFSISCLYNHEELALETHMAAEERCYHLRTLHPTDGRKTKRQMVARAASGANIGKIQGDLMVQG